MKEWMVELLQWREKNWLGSQFQGRILKLKNNQSDFVILLLIWNSDDKCWDFESLTCTRVLVILKYNQESIIKSSPVL